MTLDPDHRCDVLVDALQAAIPAALGEHGIRVDSCIIATAVGLEVAKAVGVRARPQAVSVGAWNPPAWEAVQLGGLPSDVAGGYSVGVTGTGLIEPVTGDWDGHLILEVGKRRWLLDATAGRFARFEHGLEIPPAVALKLPDQRLTDGDWYTARCPSGSVLTYRPIGSRQYSRHRDWRAKHVIRHVAGALIEVVREAMTVEERASSAPLN